MDVRRGLCEKGCMERTVRKGVRKGGGVTVMKGMRGQEWGERGAGRGLWQKGCKEWNGGKGMHGGDCGEMDAWRGL